jgi:hypothetical protein
VPASRPFGPPPEWPPHARLGAWISLVLVVVEAVALVLDWSGTFRLAIGIAFLISASLWIGQFMGRRTPEADDPSDPT